MPFYDRTYLHFYTKRLTDELSEREGDLLVERLALNEGTTVLDLGCGHGRITNQLGRRGVPVVGIDSSADAIEVARAEAARLTLNINYHVADMRSLPSELTQRFDRVLIWFSTFGCVEDGLPVAKEVYRCLRPGGSLVLDQVNKSNFMRREFPITEAFFLDGDALVNRITYDIYSDTFTTVRTATIRGKIDHARSDCRVYSILELKNLMEAAGFQRVEITNMSGDTLSIHDSRMLVQAVR